MSNFSILMFIFATCVLLTGFYMFKGHKLSIIAWKAAYKNVNKEGWINIGKWTMFTSIFIYLIALIALIFNFQ